MHKILNLQMQRKLAILRTFASSLMSSYLFETTLQYRMLSQKVKEDLTKIRNIGIIAHIDAGKTTTTERMLYYSGFTRAMGEVHDGDTVMDYMSQERERGITITSAAITFNWKSYRINLIDTPGHVDFTIEVERSLRVLDGAVTILDASAGVEVQTMTVWNQANRYKIPCIVYLNKMDKPSANIDMCLSSLEKKLKIMPLLLHMPIGNGKMFSGVIDLISMKKFLWSSDKYISDHGKVFTSQNVELDKDGDLWAHAAERREVLIETIADLDDDIADKLLSSDNIDSLSSSDLYAALRRITLTRSAVPVLCGSSYKNIAVQLLLDAVLMYLPNPTQRTHEFMQYYENDLCALAFKIIHDKRQGPLTFLRVYTGNIENGQKLYNVNKESREKITKLMVAFADDFQEVPSVSYGNIAVVTGLKEVVTGDTLVSSSSSVSKAKNVYSKIHEKPTDETSVVLAAIEVPDPVFFCTIEPPSLATQKQLDLGLQCLQREDPSFRVEIDEDMGQTIVSGMGELHIGVMKDRILKEYGVDSYLGPLQISYKETIYHKSSNTVIIDKTIGRTKHYVKITLSVYPNPGGGKAKTVKVIVTKDNELGKIWPNNLKAVNTGLQSALNYGPVLGFQVIDVMVHLEWLEVGRGTSIPMVSAATSQCITAALKNSTTELLEPIMNLGVTVKKGYGGLVLNDLSQRRSQILGIETREDVDVVLSRTPLSELMGYSTALRTFTSGTGNFTMEFDCYKKMNPEEQAKAVEKVTGFAPL